MQTHAYDLLGIMTYVKSLFQIRICLVCINKYVTNYFSF